MGFVAYGTIDAAEMGLMRVSVGEIFGFSFFRKLFEVSMTGKAAAVFDRITFLRQLCFVAAGTCDVLFTMVCVEML